MDHPDQVKYRQLEDLEKRISTGTQEEAVQHLFSILSKAGIEYTFQDALQLAVYICASGFSVGSLGAEFDETLRRIGWTEEQTHRWLQGAFVELEEIRAFAISQNVTRTSTSSLLSRIASSIADRSPHADDLSHVPYSGTVGSMLSGLNRFLGGTGPMHPNQFPSVLLVVTGWLTFQEVGDVRKVFKAQTQGVWAGLCSSDICSGARLLDLLFPGHSSFGSVVESKE